MTPITTGCGFNSPEWFLLRKFAFTSSTSDGMIKVCNGDEECFDEVAWTNVKQYREGFQCADPLDDINVAVGSDPDGNGYTSDIEDEPEEEELLGSEEEQHQMGDDVDISTNVQFHINHISKNSEQGCKLHCFLSDVHSKGVDGVLQPTPYTLEDEDGDRTITYDGKFFIVHFSIQLSTFLLFMTQ